MNFVGQYIKKLKHRYDAGDTIDRLNYQYSPILILISALTLFGKQYVGQPIQCWVPAQFTKPWEHYAETYCYIKNTYFLPLNNNIPHDFGDRDNKEIGYYQWVPIVLVIQACLFHLPCTFWTLLNWQSGVFVSPFKSRLCHTSHKNRFI